MSGDDPAVPTGGLEALLADWLPRQRWFAGRGVLADGVTINARIPLATVETEGEGPARFELVVLTVNDPVDRMPRRYQLWLGIRAGLPERLAHSEIGIIPNEVGGDVPGSSPAAAGPAGAADGSPSGTTAFYDALHDNALTSLLLGMIADGRQHGDLRGRPAAGAAIDSSAPGLVISAEQSNTSVVYGDSAILKVFRRLESGTNPDAEIHAALAGRSAEHVARLYGELVAPVDGIDTTLGLLTEFFANSADGWQMATASVRDLMAEADLRADEVGGDFAAESHRLGEAVAVVHAELATAFGTTTVHADRLQHILDDMASAARIAVSVVPELAEYGDAIQATFARAAESAASLTLQRIHGDLHLGQTLRTLSGWAVIDFEGEPSKPLEYRRQLLSPLRDIAGMLRSFDYAAQHLLAGGQHDAQHMFRAKEWAARNRRSFCDGYAARAGHDPRNAGNLLRAFELDKAVYEVRYEHDHRPAWLPIPLHAVAQLTNPGGSL